MSTPLWDEAVSFSSQASTVGFPPYWVAAPNRNIRQAQTQHGRQYETDQNQAATYQPTWQNQDGAFDPVNTSSPYYPNVDPFRPFRRRVQYPATVNLLTVNQATGGNAPAVPGVDGPIPNGTLLTAADAQPPAQPLQMTSPDATASVLTTINAWQGTNVVVVNYAASSPWQSILVTTGATVYPGLSHAFSIYAFSPTLAGPVLNASIAWVDVNGNVLSTTPATNVTVNLSTYSRLTTAGVAPANAAGCALLVSFASSPASSGQLYFDGLQFELNTAATAWVQPSTWYGNIGGWVERWPMLWEKNGTYSEVQPLVTDSFALLSQQKPDPCFYADVLTYGPNFFFPLNDPTGSTVFKDLTGKHNPVGIVNSPQGAGTIAPGQGVQNVTAGLQTYGFPGPIVTMTNPDTGTSSFQACSWIDLTTSGIKGPPVFFGWTRMIAFRNTGAGAATGVLWGSAPAKFSGINSLFYVAFGAGASPGIVVEVFGPGGGASVWSPGTGAYADGNWHLMFITLSSDGKTLNIWVDAANVYTNVTASDQHPSGNTTDMIGAYAYPADSQFYDGYNGDVALVAEFPTVLTGTQILDLSNSWRFAHWQESTGARYARILSYAGYNAPVYLDGGGTNTMGPAVDIDGNTDALTLLQNVVDTESGNHFVRADGRLRFEARTWRYNSLVPQFTFGENTAGGEFPYQDAAFDFDPTHIYNDVQITQVMTGQIYYGEITASQQQFGTRTLQRNVNVYNPQEAQDAATYLANRYNQPQLRLKNINLYPARYPALWPVCLALEISTRVRVMRRPMNQPAIQFDGFVEQVNWTTDPASGDPVVNLQISPADLNIYWVWSALHSTLAAGGISGTSSITVNALPDAASNPAAASFCQGLQLTLDPGTVKQETLTVASFSATSPGYTTFTVTFTGTMGFTHATNSVVCEALPTGVTDPTVYDAASILGTTTTLAY